MQGIKNLIARRRPVSDQLPEGATEAPEARLQRDPWEALQQQVSGSVDPRNCDIDSARAARNHVPRPERPQPSPRQEWMPPPAAAPEDLDELDLSAFEVESPAPPASKPKVWDLDPTPAPSAPETAHPNVPGDSALAASVSRVAARAPEPARPSSDRVKTRLLGFHSEPVGPDPLAAPAAEQSGTETRFPIGWLVVTDGPGRGASFTLTAGLSTVGRDADQTVTLDFGDTAISRERHLAIAYDEEDNRTYVGHGGKANIVRLNDKPLLSTEELQDGDRIKIGKTVLRFVGFCTSDFSWTADETQASSDG